MLYIFAVVGSLIFPNADAVESLDQSIQATQKRLDEQQKLKLLLADYNSLKIRFIKDEVSKAEAWRMVKISEEAFKLIKREHLELLFSIEFMEELKVFSSFASKPSIAIKSKTP